MTTNNPFAIAAERIRRSPYQAIAAIIVTTATFFLANCFFLLAVGSQTLLKHFESQPQINAFFSPDYVPQSDQITKIQTNLQGTGLVSNFTYISKEAALTLYKQLNKNDPLLLEAVTAQMLPASIEVSAKNPTDLKKLQEVLKLEKGIEDIRLAEDVVESVEKWSRSMRIIGAVLISSQLIISMIVIMLIISIKVTSRKEEIKTMRLLGATKFYIVGPFAIEACLYGVLGALLAWLAVYTTLLYTTSFWLTFIAGIVPFPPPAMFMVQTLIGMLLAGGLVGALGGWWSANRLLRT